MSEYCGLLGRHASAIGSLRTMRMNKVLVHVVRKDRIGQLAQELLEQSRSDVRVVAIVEIHLDALVKVLLELLNLLCGATQAKDALDLVVIAKKIVELDDQLASYISVSIVIDAGGKRC